MAIVHAANQQYNFLPHALQRVYAAESPLPAPTEAVLTPLATGGAMAVYTLTIRLASGQARRLVCKLPHDRRLVYTSDSGRATTITTTGQLLERLISLAEFLAERAPGLFPRSGGLWQWQEDDGLCCYLLVEEFIPGVSVERLKHAGEQQFTAGELSFEAYQQCRIRLERLAVATFTRLWDCLGRHTFTSDPSPWNVLVQHWEAENGTAPMATIIDLHSLEEDVGLTYVVQRLAAVYGMRQEVLEAAILPGILDTLGADEGRALLLAELPRLEAESRQTAQNLGVDLQRPLLNAIRALA
jgi:hypothetical protein